MKALLLSLAAALLASAASAGDPLPSEPAGARPHRGGMCVGLERALLWRPVGKEDKGPDHFIAPWRLVDKLEWEWREVVGWHPRGSPVPGMRAGDV